MNSVNQADKQTPKGNGFALLPLISFLFVYLCTSIVTGDFYKMPVSVAFLISLGIALFQNKSRSLHDKLESFCKGAGNSDIMLMSLIFILAGAFATVAKEMGAVDSVVNFSLAFMPSNMLLAGVFLIACFISISIGTSVGTIAALTPMAVGIAESTGFHIGLSLSAVVSGAMFGDNLSMISDTTIAATRSQGCTMRDKFRTNFRIVFPAALITIFIYIYLTSSAENTFSIQNGEYSLVKIFPYLFVLVAAILGINVTVVLTLGTLIAGGIGIYSGDFDTWGFVHNISTGIQGMSELVIICILVGGTFELIRYNGGIQFILNKIEKNISGQKGGQIGIALLVFLTNLCTANNTIAIVISGPIAKNIADKYGISGRKSASLLDTFSCFTQGIIPYGAQLLTAVGIAGVSLVSPIEVMQYLFYPILMGISAVIAIFFFKN
ncbi:Na+/H+ antiporter NhaC family protein [Sediminitomix flava]|uniref:Putative methionine transporter (NhaC family) n=1 Tax=Sediminitomix flava TaxID=379075 RepID=A0A315ZBC0_SEDFL|nr:Na+/H+ antiporter NhaC family protein [Sediminitomix flava]PWJ42014.1 putative methionine transporter (NhaC family) [Sediminitomix flava]